MASIRAACRIPPQLKEELERFAINAILRVIEVNTYSLGRETLAALWVLGEQVTEIAASGFPDNVLRAPSMPDPRWPE